MLQFPNPTPYTLNLIPLILHPAFSTPHPKDARGRAAALRVHARGVPMAAAVDFDDVAARTER